MSLNKVMLIGNLGKDPEIRTLNGGNKLATFSLAVSETWRDKNSGERKERTEWINIVIFNEALAETTERYLKKGSKVYLEGKFQTRKWTDKNGSDRWSTEVVIPMHRGQLEMLGDRQEDRNGDERPQARPKGRTSVTSGPQGSLLDRPAPDIDEEIPF